MESVKIKQTKHATFINETFIQKPEHKYNLRTQILYMYRKTEMSPRYSQGTIYTYHKYNKHTHK
jgi:hypothetical protein